MEHTTHTPIKLVASILMAATLTATPALAQPHSPPPRHRGGHGWGYHHPYRGSIIRIPEIIADIILHAGIEYYYHHGVFYRKTPGGYVIVDAPTGATVIVLPQKYKTVIVNGRRYYYSQGVYYTKTRQGFLIIDDPLAEDIILPAEVTIISPSPKKSVTTVTSASEPPVALPHTPAATAGSYTVNIPTANGGYTAVTIKKTDNGFIGPQGEYYPEFPSVEQLKVMYGK